MKTISTALALGLLAVSASASEWAGVSGRQGPASAGTAVFRTAQEWEAAWAAAGQPGPAPEADFSKDMVVMIALGEKPTGGYTVEASLLTDPTEPSRLVVLYREIPPTSKSFNVQMRTRPWVARKVSKHATVAFEADQKVRALGSAFKQERTEILEGMLSRLKEFSASAQAQAKRR